LAELTVVLMIIVLSIMDGAVRNTPNCTALAPQDANWHA
jgi:hypothetical protein